MEENREQPIIMQAESSGEEIENGVGGEVGSQNGMGEYGKFKTARALLDAYNSLEAQFTRKCQRVSQLEKEKASAPSEEAKEFDLEGEEKKFLEKNEDAAWAIDEIKEKVESDPSLQSLSNPFEVAWHSVMANHLSDKKPNDPIVNKYVLSDDQIQRVIIENYLDALKQQKSPILISSQKGERVSEVKADTPKTLEEAKSIVGKMFS